MNSSTRTALWLALAAVSVTGQVLKIDASKPEPAVGPKLYGLMTEELVFSHDGGLYAEPLWFSMVSLFPPTFNNRPSGNRKDITQILADMKPAFLRFPGAAQSVRVEFEGLKAVEPKGLAIILCATSPDDTNSITAPTNIVPVTSRVDGLRTAFSRTFPPYSITILLMKSH